VKYFIKRYKWPRADQVFWGVFCDYVGIIKLIHGFNNYPYARAYYASCIRNTWTPMPLARDDFEFIKD
jgi:hypothetical protein